MKKNGGIIKFGERKIIFNIIVLFLIVLIISINLVSSEFGFDDPDLPKVTREPPAVITFNNDTGSVNTSNFWDGLDTINSTQMENNGGVLNILVSWLTSFLLETSDETNLNVNRSDWWDNLNTPNDISIFLLNTGDTATGNYTFDTDTFFIDSSNNRIGIGTITPQNTLNVLGDLNVTGTSYLGNLVISADNISVNNILSVDGNGILFWDNVDLQTNNFTIDTSTFFVDSNSNRVGIGTASPVAPLEIQSLAASMRQTRYSDTDVQSAGLTVQRSGGTTVGTDVIVQDGWRIANFNLRGYDGATYRTAASIQAWIDGTPGAGDMPGRLTFLTTADGDSSATERMRIDSSGFVGINTTTPSFALTVNGVIETFGALLPDADSTRNLGSSTRFWSNAFIDNIVGPTTFNTAKEDVDFRFAGDTETNLLFIDASTDRVGIGTTTPQNTLNVLGDINFTGLIYGNGSQLTGLTLTETDPIYTGENSTIARIGDCPSGQFVQNTTTGGVECTSAGSGDITSVLGDSYITNGSASGDVNLVFNDTKLNLTIDARDTNETTRFNALVGNCSAGQQVFGVDIDGVKVCVTDADSGAVNIFDQVLNTTSNVTFNNLTVTQFVSATTFLGDLAWSFLNSYPTACSTSETITTIGDTITCSAIALTISQITDIGNANVNRSDWWDNLNTPNDISIFLLNTGDTATGNYTFDSGTFFIDSNSNRVGIGTTTIPHGGIGLAKFAIEGDDSSTSGSHIQYTTDTDDLPLFQQLNWAHDDIALTFDAYYNGTDWRSSVAAGGSNFQIIKNNDTLKFNANDADLQIFPIDWTSALTINNGGRIGIGAGTSGLSTFPATILHVTDESKEGNLAGVTIERQGTIGDSVLQFLISSIVDGSEVTRWVTGIDNSDSDKYIISNNASSGFSSGVNALTIDTSNNIVLAGELTVGTIKGESSSTAIAPSYAFDTDVDTGIFRAGNDALGLSAGGLEMIRLDENAVDDELIFNELGADIDFRIESDTDTHAFFLRGSDGNVGIGVSSFNSSLDITGSNAGTNSLRLRSGDSSTPPANSNQVLLSFNGGTSFTHSIKSRHNSISGSGNAIDFYVWDWSTDANGDIGTLHTMTLENGSVGIGTTSPQNTLNVIGEGNFTGNLTIGDCIIFSNGGQICQT